MSDQTAELIYTPEDLLLMGDQGKGWSLLTDVSWKSTRVDLQAGSLSKSHASCSCRDRTSGSVE